MFFLSVLLQLDSVVFARCFIDVITYH